MWLNTHRPWENTWSRITSEVVYQVARETCDDGDRLPQLTHKSCGLLALHKRAAVCPCQLNVLKVLYRASSIECTSHCCNSPRSWMEISNEYSVTAAKGKYKPSVQ